MSYLLIFLVAFQFSSLAWSASNGGQGIADSTSYEEDLAAIYGGEEYVSIATGSQQLLSRAPAVASVITANDIERMGATELNEILETVPGLHVSVSSPVYNPIFQIRGIHSDANPQVLMLINGIPVTNIFAGNRSIVWGGMPVNNIARVEVIRGPGSAVYGADAFAGVINIITKTADDIDGLDIGFRAGEFATKQGWLQYGSNFGDLDVAFSFEAGDTDGYRRAIGSDAQSFFDQTFGTSASLAPGSVNVGRQYFDTRLDLGLDNWRLRLGFQGRDEIGTGAGGAQALDPVGESESTRFNADLTYQNTDAFEDWDITAQLSFFDVANRSDLVLFPPGSAFPDNTNSLRTFPFGVIGNPDSFERHYRANLSGIYHGFRSQKIRLDAGFRFEDLYKIKESKNFFQAGAFPIPLPGGVTDVSSTAPFLTTQNRKVTYVFAQDEWSFAPDWTLTAGLRFDHYSDFGSTVNPRVALVWQTSYNLTSKLLYGRAFRAPSFTEQFSVNNPVALGNPNLDPETINTVELAFDYQASPDVHTKLNLFWYGYEDIIRLIPDATQGNTFQNAGNQTGYGLELEAQWKIVRNLQLHANYAFQLSEDETTGQDVGFAPTQQIYGRADWQFWPSWNLDAQVNWVADRKRPSGDNRAEIDNYVTLDMTLRGEDIFDNWGVSASVRNLFNSNALEPSQPFPNANSSLLPGDLPLASRSFYFELRYQLK